VAEKDLSTQLLEMVVALAADVRMLREESRTVAHELREHMREEGAEDKLIIERLGELNAKIDGFAPITTAFVRASNGEPDYTGHHADHSRRIDDAIESANNWRKIYDSVQDVVIRGLTYGAIILLLMGVRDWVNHPTIPSMPQAHEVIGK
jgi:hypothetical protein